MKKTIVAILALLLMAALTVPALAYWGTVYVNKDKLKIYAEDNTDSKVLKKVKGGKKLEVSSLSPDGKWAQLEDGGFAQMKYLTQEMPQDYCKHDWSKWKVKKEATCTEDGSKQRTCSICGLVKKKKIEATGHSWGKWKVLEQATCSVEGKRTRTCQVCGEKQTKSYLDDHTYGVWEMTKEPSCTEKGERVHTCQVCGHVETQALDMLPHEYEWKVTVEATDHSAGVRSKICVNCGHDGGEESFDPEGTLRRKDKGEDVYNMQQLLVEQGYLNAGGADGVFGGGTEKALTHYQQDRGLNPDGIGWPETLEDLQHDFGPWETVKEMTRISDGERVRVCRGCGFEQHETISAGTVFERKDRGENIRALQQMLSELGYNAGGYDGIYGKKLDAAMAGFAADHGGASEDGKIRPADVDDVLNAWLDTKSAEQWKGEGDVNSPVNLALTVNPAEDVDDSGIAGYNWSLTNLGSEKVTFAALLLNFGDTPDFTDDNLVMQLDGVELKPNSQNSASGSFSVNDSWGKGNLNFVALGMNDATGELWLSNIVDFANSEEPAAKTVAPQRAAVDVNALADGIYPVAFNPGDVLAGASGIFINAAQIYDEDVYDIVDVNTLEVGDTVVVQGVEIPVTDVARDEEKVLVNGGADAENGVTFIPLGEDSNGYRVALESGMATYTLLGSTTLTLDESAVLNESWNIEAEPVTVAYDGIVKAVTESENTYFNQYNTYVCVEGGKVVEIDRVYVD